METQTTKPDSPKGKYFRQKAESFRQNIKVAEAKLIRYQGYAKQCTDAGKPIPKEIADTLAFLENEIADARREMRRSLYNAGRL